MRSADQGKFKVLAGAGARDTPREALDVMALLGRKLEEAGYKVRAGGAPGADRAVVSQIKDPQNMAIYLPKSADRRGPDPVVAGGRVFNASLLPGWEEAHRMAREYDPGYDYGPQWRKDFMARNAVVLLGPQLDRPADLLLAYTTKGLDAAGGTPHAMRMAGALGIPIRNLADPAAMANARRYLGLNQDVAAAARAMVAPFEIVASRGPGASFDVWGMRAKGNTMATVKRPGEPGWLGNPYVANDAGGTYSRQEATNMFGRLIEEKAQDPVWRQAFMDLQGKRVGYYKPDEKAIHLHELQSWIARNLG